MTVDQLVHRRWLSHVDMSGDCWVWDNPSLDGYGKFRIGDTWFRSHRLAYEHYIGPIPGGLQIDHLCRNRACVNPDHLEPVTSGENTRRGDGVAGINARKTHCLNGHEFTADNTAVVSTGRGRVGRRCLTCQSRRVQSLTEVAS